MSNRKHLQHALYLSLLSMIITSGLSWAQDTNPSPSPQGPAVDQASSAPKPVETEVQTEPQVKPQAQAEPPKAEPKGPPPPPPQAKMVCSPKPIPVVAPLTCVVTITHPANMTVKVNAPTGAESGFADLPEPTADGQLVTKRLFTIRQLELDKPLRVKNVQVSWSAVGGHEGVVKIPNQKIPVRSTLMGVSAPLAKDFANPSGQKSELGADKDKQTLAQQEFWQRHAPPSLMEPNWTLIVILSILAVSAIGVFLGWVIRIWAEARARNRAPYVDPRPAHVIAFEALDKLAAARLIEDGAFKIYSQRLSEIARAYFGKRYDFNGLEMTSDELREALSDLELTPEAYLVLEDFLSDTDLIKFADLSTSASAIEESRNRVYRLIDLTKLEEVDEVDADASEAQQDTTKVSSEEEDLAKSKLKAGGAE